MWKIYNESVCVEIVHWTSSAKRAEPSQKEAYFDSEATEGVIYDLKPNKKNFAQVLVYNNAGDGPASDTIDFVMPEGGKNKQTINVFSWNFQCKMIPLSFSVPTPVQDVSVFPISEDEIGLLWKPPREVNGNLTGYEIKVCPSMP